MSGLYAHFDSTITQAKNNWERNFVLQYSNAYVTARKNFMDKLDAQKKADEAAQKRISELAMTALTFCGGKLLTVVFASSALKVAASELTIGVLEKNNMTRTLGALNFLQENKTAQFALGKAWDKGKDLLSDKTKKLFEETGQNYPSLSEFAKEPQIMQNHLQKWVLDVYGYILKAEQEIREKIPDDSARTPAIEALLDSTFVRTAPENSLGSIRTPDEIEFSFYMKLLLEIDYMTKGHYYNRTMKGDSWEYRQIDSRKPISESPSSSSYPQGTKNGKNFESVDYNKVGSILRTRIDELGKKLFSAPFFLTDEHISHSTLLRAESKLAAMSNVNLEEIKKSLFGPPKLKPIAAGPVRRVPIASGPDQRKPIAAGPPQRVPIRAGR
jgi:hypothetical protein